MVGKSNSGIWPGKSLALTATLAVGLFLLTSGCSILRKTNSPPEALAKPDLAGKGETNTAAANMAAQAEQAMAAKEYPRAIDFYKESLAKNPGNLTLQADFLAAMELIKKEADAAKKKNAYSLALDYYRLLLKNYESIASFSLSPSFSQDALKNEIKECLLSLKKIQAGRALKAGAYEQAVTILVTTLNEYPQESNLVAFLNQTIAEIKAEAGKAFAGQEYLQAGKFFSLLRELGNKYKNYVPLTGFEREELDGNIRICILNLFNQGLVEYRKGNLKEAIAMWESILSFQPDHEEVKKAIQTARHQLEKIKR